MNAEPKTRRCPLWVKIALACSLAVNLAIAGLGAGIALKGGPTGGRGAAMGYAIPYVLALPRDLRREVFGAVRSDERLPDRQTRRAEYREMIRVLQATPFDAAAVRVVLERQGEAASRVQSAAQAAWLDVVAGMSDEQRVAYTERLQEALNRKSSAKHRTRD